MIKNEKQFKIAKAKLEKWLKNLEATQSVAEPQAPEWVIREQILGINEQVRQLQEELKEYQDTISGGISALPDPSMVDEIPSLLIKWRIARRLTQKELADQAGIHENLLQKYEAENYGGASYNTIVHIAHVLKGESKFI